MLQKYQKWKINILLLLIRNKRKIKSLATKAEIIAEQYKIVEL